MLRIVIIFICLLLSLQGQAASIENPFPRVAASYILTVNGADLWSYKPHRRLPPASLTKVMTALIVLEKASMHEIVVVTEPASRERGSRIGLRAGEQMQVGFLLAAALIRSANDACHALADHIAGSEEQFVILMNRKAGELGMKDTHFVNACGFDNPGHYSTAHDLTILAEAALRNRVFAELVKVGDAAVESEGGKVFKITNTNALIGRYPGAVGVKSGYTSRAGKCLIATAERGGRRALLVLLNAPNRWWDASAMLDRALEDPFPVSP